MFLDINVCVTGTKTTKSIEFSKPRQEHEQALFQIQILK